MAISAQDVLTPVGRIDPAIIWPGLAPNAVQEKIRAFITDAENRTADADDPATSAAWWVYYRAKSEQYERMIGMPATVTDSDEGSSSYFVTQLQLVKDERDAYLAEFDDSLAEAEDEDEFQVIQSLR